MNKVAVSQFENLLDADQQLIIDFYAGKIYKDDLIEKNKENIVHLNDLIAQQGLPTKINASAKAYKAVTVIALHSDNLELMRKVIDLFKTKSEEEIELRDIGYLTDKIRILQNKPQVYGTQFKRKSDGTVEFLPIEDVANINLRRSQLKMGPFEEYKQMVEQAK